MLIRLVSTWHPVAWAVVAVCLPFAVELTSHARSYFTKRGSRGVRTASFERFSTATIHGFSVGADTHAATVRIVALAVSTVFVGLAVVGVCERARSRSAVFGSAAAGRAMLLNR
ncbi:MAG: hypothetical protein ACLPVY_14180 [Acidimicrobiia bacterium]